MAGKYRITGEFGVDNIPVKTEPLDEPRGVVEGMKLGFEVEGWENVEIEEVEGS